MTKEAPAEVRYKAKQIWHNFKHLLDDPECPKEMAAMLNACREIAGIPEDDPKK